MCEQDDRFYKNTQPIVRQNNCRLASCPALLLRSGYRRSSVGCLVV